MSLTSGLPFGALAVVFVVTLAIWIFFDVMGMPLQPASTTVVAAVVVGLVILVRWFRGRSHSKEVTK